MYAMGSFMTSWVKMASVCAVVHIVHVGAVFLMLHESPSWLVRNGRMFEAKRSLAFFRRLSLNEVKNELAAMISSTRPVVVVRSGEHDTDERPTDLSTDPAPSSSTSAPEDAINDTSDDPPTSVWKVLRETENWHQIVIMCCLFYFQQTAGGSVFIAFASDFVKRIGVPDDKLGGVTILMGVMPLLIVTMVCFLNAFVGRRFLLIASGSGMTLTTFGVGLHLLVCENEVISFPGYMLWYPVMLLTIYVMFCHLGFLPIPWLMIGEVFPPRCRGSAGGIVSSLANLMNFAVLALYPALVSHLATYYIYFFFSTMALMGTLLVIFFVKESRHISM